MMMDGMPGLIHSGDDFGVNAAGIAITETTISEFNGFDPAAFPNLCVRGRPCSIPRRSTISRAS